MEAQNLEVYHPPSLRITNSVTVTLTEKNYILWKSQFEAFLNGQGLLGYVTGQTLQPAASLTVTGLDGSATQTPNPESTKWFQTDQVVKSWLLGSFSEDILSLVVDCQTSNEVWLSLARYYNRSTSSRLFELQRKLQTITKSAKPMAEYL